ncbi:sulfotransferase [Cyanobium sp. LEGE 06113]|jgi:hypothetical protein|uniref:sulfotransferase n=1 Tax=Cyanobium sp. LEGE 06113 TaxID=1297573 RepID=UPI001880818F|nr:sulfotransferase [Cyanobium sp. LEGE 06113]MBE9152895.1 sulfotransferase [Cyanobium sp. LEGE 06113]
MYAHPYVVIIAVGRSGSTILQSILNAAPYTLVRGENNNFFYWQFKSYLALTAPGPRPRGLNSTKPWFGYEFFNPRNYLERMREVATDFLLGNHNSQGVFVLGFKEIRFFEIPIPELNDYLDFLDILFPGVVFVLLQREPAEICKSSWWKKRLNSELVNQIHEFYASVLSRDRKNLITIEYSKIRDKDLSYLESSLFKPLDIPFIPQAVLECLGQELNHCR